MPFLNCIEKCDQNGSTQKLPELYKDLSEWKLRTLSEYRAEWRTFKSQKIPINRTWQVFATWNTSLKMNETGELHNYTQLYTNLVTGHCLATFCYLASLPRRRGVVVITIAQLHPTKSQVQILLAACRRFAMVRINDNGPGWK